MAVKGVRGAFAEGVTRADLGEGLWVDLKTELKYSERRQLRNSFVAIDESGQIKIKGNPADSDVMLMELAIMGWNFEHDGEVVEVCRENIDELRGSIATKILQAINDLYAEKDISQKKGKS